MLENIFWFRQISAVMFRSSPWEVLLIVVFSLFSKVSSLLALFLPIKIILLIGHEKTPKYFPDYLSGIERDKLIIALCVLAIAFYILHAILEIFIQRLERKGANKLSLGIDAGKLNNTIPGKIFRRVSKGHAEIIFSISALIFISWIYPALFLFVLLSSLIILALHEFLTKRQKSHFSEDLEYDLEGSSKKIWFDIGFLLAFVFIVWKLMTESEPNIFAAFISFLLLRQSAAGLKRLTNDFSFLVRQQKVLKLLIRER